MGEGTTGPAGLACLCHVDKITLSGASSHHALINVPWNADGAVGPFTRLFAHEDKHARLTLEYSRDHLRGHIHLAGDLCHGVGRFDIVHCCHKDPLR